MMRLRNPFLTSGYYSPEYFCDRELESRELLSALENGRNVTLIAPRRYGKTGLVRKVLDSLPKGYVGIYLDIYSVTDLSEFTRRFASSVVGALDTTLEKTLKTLRDFFRSCRPTVTPSGDGSIKLSFDVVPSSAESTLKEVFEYLSHRDVTPVIVIDEFQQISEFPEQGTEALLRSYIQFVPQVRFIFCGSRQHLMREMFLSAQRPFFQSTQLMGLGAIPESSYYDFAVGFYSHEKREFNRELFSEVYQRFEGITWYVQAVLNRLWSDYGDVTERSQVDAVVEKLVQERSFEYYDLLRSQNSNGIKLLKAVAKEGCVQEPMSGDFVMKYSLKSPSSVRVALKGLLENDLLYQQKEGGYVIYDRLFGLWLAQQNA